MEDKKFEEELNNRPDDDGIIYTEVLRPVMDTEPQPEYPYVPDERDAPPAVEDEYIDTSAEDKEAVYEDVSEEPDDGSEDDSEEPDDAERAGDAGDSVKEADADAPAEEKRLGLAPDGPDGEAPAAEVIDDMTAEEQLIREKIRARKAAAKARARRNSLIFRTTLIVLVVTIAGLIFTASDFFTVTSIDVRGNSHFTAEEIRNIAHASPGSNIIYRPGKAEMIEYLEQNPYIESATVSTRLPSTLVINVVERQEACTFRYDDDYLVMDGDGILLRKTRTEPLLTKVEGLVVSKIKLGEKVGTKDTKLFDKTLKLVRTMMASDMYFVRIDMSKSTEIRAYIYDTLIVRGTYEEIIENLENGHIHKVVEKLFDEGIRRGTISFGEDGTMSFGPGL